MMSPSQLINYAPAPSLLNDRVILITGAGRGIGRSLARSVAAHGATAVLLGRKVAALESLYDEIMAAGGPQPAIYPLDLLGASPLDHEQMAAQIQSQLGRLDGLVANAAILGTLGPLHHSDPEEFTRVLHVNATASYLLCRACIPLMQASEDASIVLSSSGVGRKGRAYWGAYSISKFAVEGLSQVLADELERTSIRVNTLNPGPTRTDMRGIAYPAEDPSTRLTPDQIMGAYLYLLGADSKAVNGQSLDAQ